MLNRLKLVFKQKLSIHANCTLIQKNLSQLQGKNYKITVVSMNKTRSLAPNSSKYPSKHDSHGVKRDEKERNRVTNPRYDVQNSPPPSRERERESTLLARRVCQLILQLAKFGRTELRCVSMRRAASKGRKIGRE